MLVTRPAIFPNPGTCTTHHSCGLASVTPDENFFLPQLRIVNPYAGLFRSKTYIKASHSKTYRKSGTTLVVRACASKGEDGAKKHIGMNRPKRDVRCDSHTSSPAPFSTPAFQSSGRDALSPFSNKVRREHRGASPLSYLNPCLVIPGTVIDIGGDNDGKARKKHPGRVPLGC